jgi:hypothetical protein
MLYTTFDINSASGRLSLTPLMNAGDISQLTSVMLLVLSLCWAKSATKALTVALSLPSATNIVFFQGQQIRLHSHVLWQ